MPLSPLLTPMHHPHILSLHVYASTPSFAIKVPSVSKVLDLPFLDGGVRRTAKIGSKVYVARLDAVERRFPGLVPLDKLPPHEQSRYSIVWNTGRCGSTLMHRYINIDRGFSLRCVSWCFIQFVRVNECKEQHHVSRELLCTNPVAPVA